MQIHVIRLLTLLAAAAVADGRGAPSPQTGPSDTPVTDSAITVKSTEAVRVAYLEHVGPYWAVGPLFRRVGRYMLEHDQSGLMFARYLNALADIPADAQRSEIGFVIQGDLLPEPPFKECRWNPGQVASMVVDRPSASTRRYHAKILAWLKANGHEPAGPITELYHSPSFMRPDAGNQRMEIQILLGTPMPPGDEGPTPETLQSETAPPVAGPSLQRPVPREPPVVPAKPDIATDRPGDPATARDIQRTPADKAPEPPAAGGKEMPSIAKARPPSIEDLVAGSQFDRVARLLMPEDSAIPEDRQTWLGQMVFLIGAAAKGVERKQPGEAEPVTALAEAIQSRYLEVSAQYEFRPIDQVVIRFDPSGDPLAAAKQAIMHELSSLLAEVSHQSVDAESALARLGRVLQKMHDLLHANREGS